MHRKTPEMIIKEYRPERPKKWALFPVRLLLRTLSLFRPARFSYGFDKKAMRKKQIVVLADHASYDDFIHVCAGCDFTDPNVIVGYHNLFVPGLFRLLLGVGVIPKSLYESDVASVRNILRLKKEGASFLLFPEGIQSMSGGMQPLNPSTVRLLKKLGLETVLCTSRGAYLSRPRFDRKYRRGRAEYRFETLFSTDDLEKRSEEDLYRELLGRFRYNDFQWNAEAGNTYKSSVPLAHGLENLLYLCPVCGREFTLKVEGTDVVCEACGNRVTVGPDYGLTPAEGSKLPVKRIDEWYGLQVRRAAEEAEKEDFSIFYPAEYQRYDLSRMRFDMQRSVGAGTVTLDREKWTYRGTMNGEEKELSFELRRIPSAPYMSGTGNEFYYGGDYHAFLMTGDRRLSVKVLLMIEALHNRTDAERAKYYEDAYGAVKD